VRYRRHDTQVCVVDPEGSAFFEGWTREDSSFTTDQGSRIEGIGRPRVEPSFVSAVVDAMIAVPDAASVAAARWCSGVTGRMVGGSTGTALWGALKLIAEMRAEGRTGSVVTLLCDGGERYTHSYYDDGWLADQGLDITPYLETLEKFAETGDWVEPAPR
jgi:cysteine synthase